MSVRWGEVMGQKHSLLCCFLLLLLLPGVLFPGVYRVVVASPDVPEGQSTWEYLAHDPDSELDVTVQVGPSNVTIWVSNTVVYEVSGMRSTQGGNHKTHHRFGPHAGVHLVVVEPKTGRVMLRQRFLTYQPAEHMDLASTLASIQSARLVILAAIPEWLLFMGKTGRESLESLGFRWCSRVASSEGWVGVVMMGVGVVAETTVPWQWRQNHTNPFTLHLSLPRLQQQQGYFCKWHNDENLKKQAAFCRQYEGYGDLCRCHNPFTPALRFKQERVVMVEQIPVVVVTANKPHHLYRLLRNLFSIDGGGQTEVLVAADGGGGETLALAQVLGVAAVAHRPQGLDSNRTNTNVRFALYTVFSHFPQADKAIVLEDDLILSPDFFSFFHQASWILNNDPTVFCVNAFNSNSLPVTASDTTRLLRSESFPMYGWMVRRNYARQIVVNWIPLGPGDWDWWLMGSWAQRGRDVVSPEVSRTRHAGNAGAHVDGFEQHLYYSRVLASTDPHTRLHDLKSVLLHNYMRELRDELQRSEIVTLDPRERDFLPKGRPGPFVTYVRAGTRNDEYFSFRLFLMSTRTYYWDTREVFRGVMRLRLEGRLFYVVGCPLSQDFCQYKPPTVPVLSASPELIREVTEANNVYEQSLYEYGTRRRYYPAPPNVQADLLNFII
ncbi:hypothetical protein Pcinc_025989 [Petrolisthes cinctipes]|uniref:Alpha-1,3-mannosyl-glycoprotein 2-beta-N-acetylglucosaminyltransferase n=1 Tax=Petrolisthes cinctipes TaxID=88211 RepID=A0AAE1F7R4_PETCI|nr:hypothetical protein Pcinc_025989 [Petrolisthes cinctipes]